MNPTYIISGLMQNKRRFSKALSWHHLSLALCLSLAACSFSAENTVTKQFPISTQSEERTKGDVFTVQLLGINDFHGQLLPIENQGGMYNLSHHLLSAIESTDEHSFVLHAGDHVGASPAESALLKDEPAIDFLNIIQSYCQTQLNNRCRIIGTAGNHEFDEGSDEMLRLLKGGNHETGPFIHSPWLGTNYQTISANVKYEKSQELMLEPYVIHKVNGVPIGFIGITLDITPELVIPGMIDNLAFGDQSDAVIHYVDELQSKGVESIVVIVHDGTGAEYYDGATQNDADIPTEGRFRQFLSKLPSAVDVVVSGHSHLFTNSYVANRHGKKMLVTQAFANGRAYADISISIDRKTEDIVKSSAEVIYAKEDLDGIYNSNVTKVLAKIGRLISQATDYAKEYTQTIINTYEPTENEIPLGQFIADIHQHALKSDCAIMNSGGVRATLEAGETTWGELFAIQPFGNELVERRFSGKQLVSLITSEHYWSSSVVIGNDGQITLNGEAIKASRYYTVAGNAYIMNSEPFSVGEMTLINGTDIEKTVDYIKSLPTPFNFRSVPTS